MPRKVAKRRTLIETESDKTIDEASTALARSEPWVSALHTSTQDRGSDKTSEMIDDDETALSTTKYLPPVVGSSIVTESIPATLPRRSNRAKVKPKFLDYVTEFSEDDLSLTSPDVTDNALSEPEFSQELSSESGSESEENSSQFKSKSKHQSTAAPTYKAKASMTEGQNPKMRNYSLLDFVCKANKKNYTRDRLVFSLMNTSFNIQKLCPQFSERTLSELIEKTDALIHVIMSPSEPYCIKNNAIHVTTKTLSNIKINLSEIGKNNILKEVFVRILSVRIAIEVEFLSMPFPLPENSLKQAKEDFENLCQYHPDGKTIKLYFYGQDASGYFLAEERYKVPKDSYFGPSEKWEKRFYIPVDCHSAIKRFFKNTHEKKDSDLINNLLFLREVNRNRAVDQFRPTAVLDIIAIIKNIYPDFEAVSVYDPCGGWADRLVGFLAAQSRFIVYNDVNIGLKKGYENVVKTFSNPETQTVHLLFKPAEDLTIDEVCQGSRHDLILTGVPFFAKELYLGDEQSHRRYPNVEAWLNHFLYKVVYNAILSLKENGFLALNINDVTIQKTRFKLVEPLRQFLKELPLVQLFDDLIYPSFAAILEPKLRTTSPIILVRRNDKSPHSVPFLLKLPLLKQSAPKLSRASKKEIADQSFVAMVDIHIYEMNHLGTSLIEHLLHKDTQSACVTLKQIFEKLSVHNIHIVESILSKHQDKLSSKDFETQLYEITELIKKLKKPFGLMKGKAENPAIEACPSGIEPMAVASAEGNFESTLVQQNETPVSDLQTSPQASFEWIAPNPASISKRSAEAFDSVTPVHHLVVSSNPYSFLKGSVGIESKRKKHGPEITSPLDGAFLNLNQSS